MTRVVVHRSNGVSEIIQGKDLEVESPHEGTWVGYLLRRPDGWPLCPGCGEDELYSPELPKATEETIVGCYACEWKPTPKRSEVDR